MKPAPMRPTVDGMTADGHVYTGFLYAGLMIDEQGQPRVINSTVVLVTLKPNQSHDAFKIIFG